MNGNLDLATAIARLEDWTARMHEAEAAGDSAQHVIAKRLVHAYTFLVANMEEREEAHSTRR